MVQSGHYNAIRLKKLFVSDKDVAILVLICSAPPTAWLLYWKIQMSPIGPAFKSQHRQQESHWFIVSYLFFRVNSIKKTWQVTLKPVGFVMNIFLGTFIDVSYGSNCVYPAWISEIISCSIDLNTVLSRSPGSKCFGIVNSFSDVRNNKRSFQIMHEPFYF